MPFPFAALGTAALSAAPTIANSILGFGQNRANERFQRNQIADAQRQLNLQAQLDVGRLRQQYQFAEQRFRRNLENQEQITQQGVDLRNRLRRAGFSDRTDAYNRRVEALNKKRELDYEVAKKRYAENAKAVQRSTEAALTKLSDSADDYMVRAAQRNRRLAEAQGIRIATGQTGKTVQRLERLQEAAAGRSAAADFASKEREIGAYNFNQDYLRDQAEAANRNIYDSLRYNNYDPGPKPFFEGEEEFEGFQEFQGLNYAPLQGLQRVRLNRPISTAGNQLAFGIGTGVAQGALSFFGALPGSSFTGGGTGAGLGSGGINLGGAFGIGAAAGGIPQQGGSSFGVLGGGAVPFTGLPVSQQLSPGTF